MNLPFAARWMHLEGTILSEISYREGEILHDFTYLSNLKNNKQHKRNRLTDTENRLVVARGKGYREMGKIGEGD